MSPVGTGKRCSTSVTIRQMQKRNHSEIPLHTYLDDNLQNKNKRKTRISKDRRKWNLCALLVGMTWSGAVAIENSVDCYREATPQKITHRIICLCNSISEYTPREVEAGTRLFGRPCSQQHIHNVQKVETTQGLIHSGEKESMIYTYNGMFFALKRKFWHILQHW